MTPKKVRSDCPKCFTSVTTKAGCARVRRRLHGETMTCDRVLWSVSLQYEYALRHLYVLVNLCEEPYPIDR